MEMILLDTMEAPRSQNLIKAPTSMSQWRLHLSSAPLFFLGPTSYENVYSNVNGKKTFSLVKIGAAAGSHRLC
jgi:hypothetical protein